MTELEPNELPEALQPDEGVTGHLAVMLSLAFVTFAALMAGVMLVMGD